MYHRCCLVARVLQVQEAVEDVGLGRAFAHRASPAPTPVPTSGTARQIPVYDVPRLFSSKQRLGGAFIAAHGGYVRAPRKGFEFNSAAIAPTGPASLASGFVEWRNRQKRILEAFGTSALSANVLSVSDIVVNEMDSKVHMDVTSAQEVPLVSGRCGTTPDHCNMANYSFYFLSWVRWPFASLSLPLPTSSRAMRPICTPHQLGCCI